MATAIDSTEWPSTPIAPEVQQLISLFFHLVDQTDDNIGTRLASEVFTPDGKLLTVQGAAIGSEAISRSRAEAWKAIKSRHHQVLKVYASDAAGTDVLLIGKLTAGLRDESTTVTEFVARVVVERGTSEAAAGKTRMKLYQVWAGPPSVISKDEAVRGLDGPYSGLALQPMQVMKACVEAPWRQY